MGLTARKPAFGVCDLEMLNSACSATETSKIIEIFCAESLDIFYFQKANTVTKALTRLHRCVGWSAPLVFACNKKVFSRQGPYKPLCDKHQQFDLILFLTSQSTIFQLRRDGSSWVEPVLSKYNVV